MLNIHARGGRCQPVLIFNSKEDNYVLQTRDFKKMSNQLKGRILSIK